MPSAMQTWRCWGYVWLTPVCWWPAAEHSVPAAWHRASERQSPLHALQEHPSSQMPDLQNAHRYFTWIGPTTGTHTHTRLTALCPGLPGWAGTRKVEPIWILLKQETVIGSGISWAIGKSAPRYRQITTPASHHSGFLQAGCPSCRPTDSVKALNAHRYFTWIGPTTGISTEFIQFNISMYNTILDAILTCARKPT